MDQFIYTLAVNAIPFLLAITLHEAAHGYAARVFGDRTAEMLGRITLNPVKHIDWIGTVAIPSLTLLIGGVFFGWAKPVPVNTRNLRNPKRDMIWVAAAGPAANLVMAIGWALVFKFAESSAIDAIARAGMLWNVGLMALNLLPILPLDGGRIVAGLLPGALEYKFSRLEPYGLFIVLGLAVAGVLGVILSPLYDLGFSMLRALIRA
ncbi:MAG: site-2 protease family protein [Burkholderiales bacterium]|nr:MAG: site-2 protease family protein [Burkholderiales bacterium]TAG77730.1 MAG: site-2 protease family protein [Betaproteobacteria bacterium]